MPSLHSLSLRNILSSGLILMLAVVIPLGSLATCYGQDLVIYCGRSKSLVEPIVERFQEETGTNVEVRYGGTTQLALAIQQEGRRSPADLFWAQDTGALEAITADGLFAKLPDDIDKDIIDSFRPTAGTWVPTTARARVLAYAPARVSRDQLPESVFDLTDAKWKGRVGWAPANASFQAFVTAMRVQHGEEKTAAWLQGMKANQAKAYPKNTPIIDALAAGEIDLGLPNHYYLLGMKKENPSLPVEQTLFADGDLGNLVFVAGIGVLKSSQKQAAAQKFVQYLISDPIQADFTTRVNEYPVTNSAKPAAAALDPQTLQKAAPDVPYADLEDLDGTLKLLRRLDLL